jgi:nucleoside-diphosphate-sugar epimerase
LPDTPYGTSKRDAELSIQRILLPAKADWCIVRPCLVYGANNPGNMRRLMQLLESGLPLPLRSVANRRSFLYVGNLVAAIEQCLESPRASRQIFNLSDGVAFSTPDLLRLLANLTNRSARLFPFPAAGLKAVGKLGDVLSWIFRRPVPVDSYSVERLLGSLEVDIGFIQTTLGWKPPFSPEQAFSLVFRSTSVLDVA